MYKADIYYHGLTPEKLHRIEGIFIYFFFLCMFYVALDKIICFCTRNPEPEQKKRFRQHSDSMGSGYRAFIPLFWYLMICLGIPLLNRAYHKNGPQFMEHCLVILSVCMVVFLIVFLIQSGCGWIWGKVQFYLKSVTVGGSTVKDRF
jgi:hypothetical protein